MIIHHYKVDGLPGRGKSKTGASSYNKYQLRDIINQVSIITLLLLINPNIGLINFPQQSPI
ncbi:unnamed protein product [Coffea canephora]|uniref:Uncharacterized protein n=1 Tax=Coffea canephora TaxID=49390 RepID=A0A068VDS5_COFCA|nr:unnamed protein product [Coffea canephora]